MTDEYEWGPWIEHDAMVEALPAPKPQEVDA